MLVGLELHVVSQCFQLSLKHSLLVLLSFYQNFQVSFVVFLELKLVSELDVLFPDLVCLNF
jgi:hypothetical protein